MRKRQLNKEEVALWCQVAKTTKPLKPSKSEIISETQKSKSIYSKPKLKLQQKTTSSLDALDLKSFKVGSRSQIVEKKSHVISHTGLKSRASKSTMQMNQKSFSKMQRGKLIPEARIDLHGMTLNQAYPALTKFILFSQGAGRRLVLVITGKGERGGAYPSTSRERGVLRRQVPQWLHTPSLRHVVLQIDHAHVTHGGEGAYYVYLKKRR